MKPPRLDRAALAGAYESVMRALAKVVTDRRWAAPLSAMALCFGLFLGVAIGPGVSGSAAGGAPALIAVAAPTAEPRPEPEETGSGGEAGAEAPAEPGGEEEEGFYEEAPLGEEFAAEEAAPETESEPREPAPAGEQPEPESEAVALKGTVVRANPVAGSYTLAAPSGELVSVHAQRLPRAGVRLSLQATPLPNNTFAEERREKSGTATQASFAGVVTFVDPDPLAPAYTVSGRGSSLLVHADPAALPTLPALGAYAKVTAAIEAAPVEVGAEAGAESPPVPEAAPPACAPEPALSPPEAPPVRLLQRQLEVEATAPATYVDLAGVLTALCPASGQILISADDLREGGTDLVLAVPAKIKTAGLKLGQPVLATAERDEAGALTLAGLASDKGRKGAEDAKSAQGDLAR